MFPVRPLKFISKQNGDTFLVLINPLRIDAVGPVYDKLESGEKILNPAKAMITTTEAFYVVNASVEDVENSWNQSIEDCFSIPKDC